MKRHNFSTGMKQIISYSLIMALGILITTSTSGCAKNVVKEKKPYVANIELGENASDKKIEPAQEILTCNVDNYTMDLTLDTENKKLSGNVIMNLTNQTKDTFDKLCIRNYAASILKNKGEGSSTIQSVTIAETKEPLNLEVKEDRSVVYADLGNHVLKPEKSLSINVSFSTDIPKQNDRFGYRIEKGNAIFQLSFCFPMLAMYENGNWNENLYIDGAESAYSKVTDYLVTLHAPEEYMIAASGNEETNGQVTTIEARNMRDMAIVASNYMSVETESVCGIKINNYMLDYENLEEYNKFSMESAKDSVALYTKLIGSYPYEELDIMQTFMSSAMEYPGLVMIGYPDLKTPNDISELGSYVQVCNKIAHEVAHQWFYASIGNDQYMEPWLDESFAEYCEDILYAQSGSRSYMDAVNADCQRLGESLVSESKEEFEDDMVQYIEQTLGKDAIINKPYNEYDTENNEYSLYVYDGGKCFLYELRKAMGDSTFFHMLRTYYENYSLEIATGNDFLDVVRAFDNSEEVENIIQKYIRNV